MIVPLSSGNDRITKYSGKPYDVFSKSTKGDYVK